MNPIQKALKPNTGTNMTDSELIAFVTQFRKGLLGGRRSTMMCAVVCAPLSTLLALHGVENEIMESEFEIDGQSYNHVWLRLPDGRALDATADQFGFLHMPRVYLGPPVAEIHTIGLE